MLLNMSDFKLLFLINFVDLYDDLVAPHLKSDILAETWLNGRDKMPSDCNATK